MSNHNPEEVAALRREIERKSAEQGGGKTPEQMAEEAVSAHPNIAEVAVVGVSDAIKGQVPIAFAVVRDAAQVATAAGRASMEREVFSVVDQALGPVGRPARVHFVTLLPKTRSGKVLRRSIQAIAEGRDPGDLTTLDDPIGIEQVRTAVTAKT